MNSNELYNMVNSKQTDKLIKNLNKYNYAIEDGLIYDIELLMDFKYKDDVITIKSAYYNNKQFFIISTEYKNILLNFKMLNSKQCKHYLRCIQSFISNIHYYNELSYMHDKLYNTIYDIEAVYSSDYAISVINSLKQYATPLGLISAYLSDLNACILDKMVYLNLYE